MSDLEPAARTAVHQCAALEAGEACVVVTDDDRAAIGRALYEEASAVSEETSYLQYQPGKTHGAEPPAPVAAAMQSGAVVFAPTTKSLTHTRARTDATDAGARVATLPGITEEVFITGLDADYETIAAHCEAVLEYVGDADEIRVTAPGGTDVTFDRGERAFRLDTGIIHEAGTVTNLPAGEVFVSPETADGTVVIDGTMHPHGLLGPDEAITIEIVDGVATAISDEEIAGVVEEAAAEVGDAAYNVAELGIGTNVGVTELVGSVLLDEKAAGTVHVAIGDDLGIGGDTEAPIHLDGIIREPTVYADGESVPLPGP
ncbi:MAG: aminopeptidase [Natrialbaceae archaeon]|nr:aminopeptidase [Natrialbaceae archaeon]